LRRKKREGEAEARGGRRGKSPSYWPFLASPLGNINLVACPKEKSMTYG
jgi:hypothetical protein